MTATSTLTQLLNYVGIFYTQESYILQCLAPVWFNLSQVLLGPHCLMPHRRAQELCESRGGPPGLPSLIRAFWFPWT